MKIKIAKSKLQEALKRVSGISDGRTTPILANVKMEVARGKLTLTTSNLTQTLVTSVECEVAEEGSITISMRRAEQIVGAFTDGVVEVVTDGMKTKMTCCDATMTLTGLPVEQFPCLPKLNKCQKYTLGTGDFREILRESAYAQSSDDTRRTLQSVLLQFGERLRAVASDGKRLGYGECSYTAEGEGVQAADYILPTASVQILSKLLTGDGAVVVQAAAGQLSFTLEDGRDVIYTKLVDGNYPEYRRAIPEDADANIVIDRSEMVAAVSRVSVLASSDSPIIKVTFSEGRATLDVAGEDESNAHERLPVGYQGTSFSLYFNPKFLLDAFKATTFDKITLNTASAGGMAVKVRGEGDKFLAVVMPMRIATA